MWQPDVTANITEFRESPAVKGFFFFYQDFTCKYSTKKLRPVYRDSNKTSLYFYYSLTKKWQRAHKKDYTHALEGTNSKWNYNPVLCLKFGSQQHVSVWSSPGRLVFILYLDFFVYSNFTWTHKQETHAMNFMHLSNQYLSSSGSTDTLGCGGLLPWAVSPRGSAQSMVCPLSVNWERVTTPHWA